MSILIAIPAAGASQRMRGRDKLLEEIDGELLLRRQALAAASTGEPVLVLLPPDNPKRTAAVSGLGVETAEVADAAKGMAASLRIAAERAVGHDGLAILLPDVPGVGHDEIAKVLSAYRAHIVDRSATHALRATDPNGSPGTPIVLPPRFLPLFRDLKGDDGGRNLLVGETVITVPFADDRATRDLDTPEDWDAYRKTLTLK